MIFYGLVLFLAFLTLFLLLKKYFHFSSAERIKSQYFLIGILIFLFMNVVFNIIFPFLLNIPQYYQLGDYSTVIPLCFISYAITRHKLMGVKPILSSILVSLIAILLTLDTLLFTTQFSVQVLKAATLLLFLFFGYYLIKSVREEVKRREDAEILSRAKSEFISMASHQLRTPLTVIKGYVAMILDGSYGKINVKAIKVLDNVSISTERLVKIIEDLLNISRIELGKMDLEKKPTDIKKMIDNICQEIKIKAQEKNLELIWEKPKAQLPKLNIDELKIRQVVYNIVDNAIKYTETGKVEIKLSRKNSNLVISISDTGRGFSDADREKLFELFTRGEAGTDTFVEGTGMGLFVAKKFANLHQGKIWAESKGKDKGSVFHIELPMNP
jgi:signal transduction histidine kinase